MALHEHDKVLDDQIDDFKARIGTADGNIHVMNTQVNDLRNILSTKGGQPEIMVDNIDEFVFATTPLSVKML